MEAAAAIHYQSDMVSAHGGEMDHEQIAREEDRIVRMWLSNLNSQHSIDSYVTAFRMFQDAVPKHLKQITTQDMMAFRDAMEGAPGTRKTRWNIIQGLFSFAHRIGYLRYNPAEAVKAPKAPARIADKILSKEQVKQMIDGESDPVLRLEIQMLYGAGLRVSELVGLKWKDIRYGHINPDVFAGHLDVFGKGQKHRTISITHNLARRIEAVRPEGWRPEWPVFASKKSPHADPQPTTRVTILRHIKAAGARIGSPGVSPHWLRHSFATHILQAGGNLDMIRQDLGHTNIATTGQYLHANPDDGGGRLVEV